MSKSCKNYARNLKFGHTIWSQNDLRFLIKTGNTEKVKNLVASLYNKAKNAIHITNCKQALNYELVLKNVRRIIEFKQKGCFKSYIDMNTDVGKKTKKWF